MKDRKVLIIGGSVISKSIIQVMNVLPSLQFVCVEASDFRKLEELHDSTDIQGIIVTPPDEVDLAKHIRLAETMGNISLLPIIILSQHTMEQHLREKLDNVFLLSTGIYMLNMSSCIAGLLCSFDNISPFESMEKMRKDLKPYIVWSKEDYIASSHDNLNRYGPLKMMREHFGTLPDYVSGGYTDFSSRIWLKKYRFLEHQTQQSQDPTEIEALFRRTIANKKILYIDDEHRLGWSFALYSLFMEESGATLYQLFQDDAHVITTPNNRFACIDQYEEASGIIDSYRDKLSKALEEYREAEIRRDRFTEEVIKAKNIVQESESKYKIAEDKFSRSETNLRQTEEKINDLQGKLKASMYAFAVEYTKKTGDVDIPIILPQVEKLALLHEQYKQTIRELTTFKEEYSRNRDILKKLKDELEMHRPLLTETGKNNNNAKRIYDESLKPLSPAKLFPYDLIILDLRLERDRDKTRLPHEISGAKILRQIKEVDPSIPVLVFTASEKAMNYQEVIGYGASGYWIKAVNSLSSLKTEIIKALGKAQDIRELWLGIRKVEAKNQLTSMRENRSTNKWEECIMNEARKKHVIILLKESFLLLIREVSPSEKFVCDSTNYGKVALNMGIILEERNGRKGEVIKVLDKVDTKIWETRNKVAHEACPSIPFEKIIEVFQKTLDKCLNY